MSHILELSGVSKSFGRRNERNIVLRDVNLTIEEGDFVSIIGYSGSGKSTLINLIAGLLKPDTGTAKMDGEIIRGPGPERGIVFQNYSLLPWLTVTENVRLAVDQIFPDLSEKQRADRTTEFVDMVKRKRLTEHLSHFRQRSGGSGIYATRLSMVWQAAGRVLSQLAGRRFSSSSGAGLCISFSKTHSK
jgi:nitrate/nitrite transport system ATP-binding protein